MTSEDPSALELVTWCATSARMARERAADERRELQRAIREARKAGHTFQSIADAAGMRSRQQVEQLLKG